jgi:hypothetical protein
VKKATAVVPTTVAFSLLGEWSIFITSYGTKYQLGLKILLLQFLKGQ